MPDEYCPTPLGSPVALKLATCWPSIEVVTVVPDTVVDTLYGVPGLMSIGSCPSAAV